ncbi:NRAMP family divalent metal transporter, partial [Acetobacterium tundrae]
MENNNISTEVKKELTKSKKIIKKIGKTLKSIGPGFVTGAADDDPSGIATYSVAGAQYGYQMTWMSLFLLPAMISIQEMCGRIGIVTGKGLAGVIKEHYSKKLLYFMVMLLVIANIINIGADLGIIAACLQMLFGQNFYMWLIVVAIGIILLEITVPSQYRNNRSRYQAGKYPTNNHPCHQKRINSNA